MSSDPSQWLTGGDTVHFSSINDIESCRRMFEEASSRLFKPNQTGEFEVLYARLDNNLAELKLERYDQTDEEVSRLLAFEGIKVNLFYIIRQENSWGRLLVAPDVFHTILSRNTVCASYLDFVRAFGYKNSDEAYLQNGYRWHISQDLKRAEYYYNLRYVEKHGRGGGDPWSHRQMGVYQQLDLVKHACRWILLQPSARALQRLKQFIALDQPDEVPAFGPDLLEPHVLIFLALARNWGECLRLLRSDLAELDEKVCFSRVGRDFKFDYSVTFADCQRLQQIRKKLLKALLSLENNLAIAKGCETIYKRLSALHKSSPRAPASLELHLHILDLKSHIRTVNSILEHASWVAVMLKDILDYRHDEAIRVNSQSLRDIASDSNRESQIIATITKEGAADSKSLKALTILATLYLPASLFATIWSSNLVQLRGPGTVIQETHFVLARQFWVYILITLAGTVFTLLYILWLSKRRAL